MNAIASLLTFLTDNLMQVCPNKSTSAGVPCQTSLTCYDVPPVRTDIGSCAPSQLRHPSSRISIYHNDICLYPFLYLQLQNRLFVSTLLRLRLQHL